MAHLKFIVKDHKGGINKDGKAIIFLRYTHLSRVTYFSSGRTIDPEFWDKRNNKVKAGYSGFSQFNMYLDKFRQKIEDYVHQALSQDIDPTIEYVREKVRVKQEKKAAQLPYIDFFSFVEQYIKTSAINKKKSTLTCYRNTVNNLKWYKEYTGEALTFDSFGVDFYDQFKRYIIETRGCGNNSFGKVIKTLKTFLNEAVERGYTVNQGYKSKKFKVLTEDVENIYLNELEIRALLDYDFSDNPNYEKVRDLFVVGCYTGLRFSDFTEIKPENIKNECIYIRTIKTHQNVVVPLHPCIREVMKRYGGKYPNNLPPAYSNQKMNDYLKEVGKLAGLKEQIIITRTKGSKRVETTYKKYELLTTHCARRSFATNLFKQGFPSLNIMKITGHRSEKSFMKYIKVKEEEAAQMLKIHWEKYYSSKASPLYKIA